MKIKKFSEDDGEFGDMAEFCEDHKIIDIKPIADIHSKWDTDSKSYEGIETTITYLVMYDD